MESIALLMLLAFGIVDCLTPIERDQVIAGHNRYRQQLVQFFNKEGKPVMVETRPMTYDLAAEKRAQDAVRSCFMSHSPYQYAEVDDVEPNDMITSAFAEWIREAQTPDAFVGADLSIPMRPYRRRKFEVGTAPKTRIGCAAHYCSDYDSTWLICQYGS